MKTQKDSLLGKIVGENKKWYFISPEINKLMGLCDKITKLYQGTR